MNLMRTIANLFGCMMSVYIAYVYCEAFLPGKPRDARAREIRFAAYTICLAGVFFVESLPLRMLLAVCWIVLLTYCYECSFPKRVYSALIVCVVSNIAEVLTGVTTVTLLGIDINAVRDSDFLYSVNVFASKLIGLLLVRVILIFAKKNRERKDNGYSAALLVVALFILFHMAFFLQATLEVYSVGRNILAVASMLLMAGAMVAVFVLNNRQTRFREYQSRLNEMENRYSLQVRNYENLRDNARVAGRNVHDVKEFVLAVSSCLEQGRIDEAKERLDEYSEGLARTSASSSGSPTVDALIGAKKEEMEALCPDRHISVVLGGNLPIDEIDLCILLGNALDNAIEESRRIADPTARSIEVRVLPGAGGLSIFVRNRMAADEGAGDVRADTPEHGKGVGAAEPKYRRGVGAAEPKYGSGTDAAGLKYGSGIGAAGSKHGVGIRAKVDLFRSRKDDPLAHGFGIGNMRAICEKYGGSLEIEKRGGYFELSVFLPE